ncbi:ATP-binding cassette domain-containing protein [bacterium]|nr:ATP-binding cassette domain-containing protein [bacterium]
MKSLRFLFSYCRPYRRQMVLALIALSFTAISVLSMGHGLRFLVDEGLGKGDPHLLDRSFLVLIGMIGMLAVASFARSFYIASVGEHVVADIRRDLFRHVVSLSPEFFDTTRTGEILSRMTVDTTLLQSVVGNTVTFALRNAMLLVGGLIMLIITSVTLTSYVLGIIPLVVIPIIILGRRVRALSRESQNKVADVSVHMEETLGSIRMVQAYGLETQRSIGFQQRVDDALGMAIRRIQTRSWLTSIVIGMVFGAIGVVLWVGGREVIAGHISPGDLSAFVFYSVVVAAAVGAISEIIGDLQRAGGAAERIVELMHQPATITAPAEPATLPDQSERALDFAHVSFHYPTRPNQNALEDFTLAVKPGEKVALVGPSGAGKSTVFALLLRFYDPSSGRISLDRVNINQLDPQSLRAECALVPQDPAIFSADAWENIRCGRPDASDEEVMQAARAARAHEFIMALPQGYESFLGERGIRLSGGQRQRIALARAILRNPRVLLLDEATSALDAENEMEVQKALETVMQGRTTIIIAHRLSTVRAADRIVVMDGGRVVAEGTHQELVKEQGLYARLAELQLAA